MTARNWNVPVVVLLAALVLPSLASASDALSIGSALPMSDAKMKNVDGAMVSIGEVKGDKGTLVIFTCNHCPYVKAWEERTVALANKATKDGFGVIAINANDPTEYKDDGFDHNVKRAKNAGMMYPYVVDKGSKLAKAFGATRTPEFFLFDVDDTLIYHGALDDNAQDASAVSATYLQDAMTAHLSGQPMKMSTTKSVGCSIKFYK